MKTMWMLLFLLLPILGLVYIGWHVYTLVPLSAAWRWGIIGLGVVSFLMLFLNIRHVIDGLPLWLARVVYDIGCSSVFVLLYLVIIFLLLDAARLFHLMPARMLHQNVYTTIAITIGMFVIFMVGNIKYYNKVREELKFTTEKQLQHPVKLVMMSDLHLGYHNTRKELARWVDMINKEQPDMVLIAGDIIDMSMRPLLEEKMAEEFHRIEAPVYACLGNHEYYSGEPEAQRFYEEAGIHLLRDTFVVVSDVCIIGRDDRSNRHRKPLEWLVAEANALTSHPSSLTTGKYTILLDHQPYHLEKTEKEGIDLQLSGHTHNGQVWPISWIESTMYECAYGRYQRGKTNFYVSSGMGIWGGKYRIGTQSEYVVITIDNG